MQKASPEKVTLPSSPRAWLNPALILSVSIALTAALYGRSLRLPFYSDDLVQIPWLRTLSPGDLWQQVSPYGYYRPLAFSLWILWRSAGLPFTPSGLRLLNLIGHTLAAGLVGWLAVELEDSSARSVPGLSGVFAAAFFAAFPFAYQAVPWVSAVFYPLVTALSVLSVLAYWRARRSGSPAWMLLSLTIAGLAPFAHENGMLIGLLIALTELAIWLKSRQRDCQPLSPWPLAHLGLDLAFLGLWLQIRSGGISTLNLSPGVLAQNGTLLIEGLSFPLLPFSTALSQINVPSALAIWIAALLSVGLLIGLTRRAWHVAFLSGGWFLVSIGPALVTMRPAWLADAPRFLYPAAVGAALWWGTGLASMRRFSRLVKGGLVVVALLPGVAFIWTGINWHLRGGEAIREAAQAAEASPDVPLLFVNLPDRLAPRQSLYPYFAGGAILLPPQVPDEEIAGAHLGTTRPDDTAIAVGRILPPVEYIRTVYGNPLDGEGLGTLITSGYRVYVADYRSEVIHLHPAGQAVETPPSGRPVACFEDSLTLWSADSVLRGQTLQLTLRWELTQKPEGTPTVFVHVTDAEGTTVAQADGDPLAGLYPFSLWPVGTSLEDVRIISLPEEGAYSVFVGVWLPDTGERLPVCGNESSDGRVLVARTGEQ